MYLKLLVRILQLTMTEFVFCTRAVLGRQIYSLSTSMKNNGKRKNGDSTSVLKLKPHVVLLKYTQDILIQQLFEVKLACK